MTAGSDFEITSEWIERLLQAAAERQQEMLQSAGLLDETGLLALLDQAMDLARKDPGQARQLALLCESAASRVNAPLLIPRSRYLRAQTHAVNGELKEALTLIEAARTAYEEMDEPLEALRTHIGRMHVLNELGRHQDALEAGRLVLEALAGQDDPRPRMLLALAEQNRGVVFETTGRYEEALAAYDKAEEHFFALEMEDRLGDIANNRGIVLVHLGRVTDALAAFEKAATIRARADLPFLEAQTWSNIGEAHLVLGSYTRSLEAFAQARTLFDRLDAQADRQIMLRKTADAYLALNLYPEALATYREAHELLALAGMADHQARALWGLGATLIALSRQAEAAEPLAEAARLFSAADNLPMVCSVLLEQAALLQSLAKPAAALEHAQDALRLAAGGDWAVQNVYANLRLADLTFPDSASEHYLAAARQIAETLNLPAITYRVEHRFGRLRLQHGRTAEARPHLEAAITQIETLRGTLSHEAALTSFLRDKAAAYEDLVRLHLLENNPEQAFLSAEQAKSRTLVDLLTGVIDSGPSPNAGDLTGRLHHLQSDLNAVYNDLLAPGGGQKSDPATLQARALWLEGEINRLRLQQSQGRPAADPFTASLSLEHLGNQLPADMTLLAYHIVGREILAFVLRSGQVTVVRHLADTAAVQEMLQHLNLQWDRFRAGRSFAERHLALLEKSVQRVLATLHQALIAPLASQLPPGTAAAPGQLVIVPHALLHQVPFQALFDGRNYLVEQFEISYAPSAAVFALCQQRGRPQPRRGLVAGVADELIPAVVQETAAVAELFEQAGLVTTQLVNDACRLAAFQEAAQGCDWLHLACHGLFRADNPLFSSLKLADQWLMAANVMGLDLAHSLVTLSACESGRSRVISGDEVIGLPRAFLGAGASTVVVSLWLVPDETTAGLMRHWYEQLQQGSGRAAALRSAQLALKTNHPHPYYWAPFVLNGQR